MKIIKENFDALFDCKIVASQRDGEPFRIDVHLPKKWCYDVRRRGYVSILEDEEGEGFDIVDNKDDLVCEFAVIAESPSEVQLLDGEWFWNQNKDDYSFICIPIGSKQPKELFYCVG